MPVIYDNQTQQDRLDVVLARLGTAAKLELGTAGMAEVLVVFPLDNPAGVAVNGELTFSGFPKTENAIASGEIASARIRTGTDENRVTGLTVGTFGADVIVSSLTAVNGQGVELASARITHG